MSVKINKQIVILWGCILLLLAAIPYGVFLVKQQQDLNTKASENNISRVEVFGPGVADYRTKTNQVKLRLVYVPTAAEPSFPSAFRAADQLATLDGSPEQQFLQNNQLVDWQIQGPPGPKTVYIQYKVNNRWLEPISASIILE